MQRRDAILGILLSSSLNRLPLPSAVLTPQPSAVSNLVQVPLLERMIHEEGTSLQELEATSFQRIRDAIGDECQVVLIGDATHGTQEFYRIRADLTKSLLVEQFDAVLVEGDFAPIYELNRFIGGARPYRELTQSLASNHYVSLLLDHAMAGLEERFPTWMWRNDVMEDFVVWLYSFNQARQSAGELPIQLLGLDIYSLFRSIDEVIDYLSKAGEVALANAAKRYYSTLSSFRPEPKGYSTALDDRKTESQAQNAARVLSSLSRQAQRLGKLSRNGDELFHALQNAKVVAAAEAHFRQSSMGADVVWKLRDHAFLERIKDTMTFIEQRKERGKKARVIVWAHNSHVGDALATEHAARGVFNVGQLCRQEFGNDHVYIVGFTTHDGTVRAAREWGERDGIMKLNPSFEGSHEYILHSVAKWRRKNAFAYVFQSNSPQKSSIDEAAREVFGVDRLERFIGVSYDRESELRSHYSICRASEQFDCLLHVDSSTALIVNKVKQHNKLETPTVFGRRQSH